MFKCALPVCYSVEGGQLQKLPDDWGKGCLYINPLNAELKTICHLLALLAAHPIFHVSRIRVKDWLQTNLPLLLTCLFCKLKFVMPTVVCLLLPNHKCQ
jgi:hypothetical protein